MADLPVVAKLKVLSKTGSAVSGKAEVKDLQVLLESLKLALQQQLDPFI